MLKKAVRCAWAVGLCLLTACAKTIPPAPTSRFTAWSQQDRTTPKRVCVLPFADQTDTQDLANKVRRSFAGNLSLKRFADGELYDIDARLKSLGRGWRNFPVPQVGKAVGCDALIYGEVTRADRLYLALYSQLTLAGSFRLVDGATGQTLAEGFYATKFRSGGVPLSPLSVVPNAIQTFSNLSDTQMTRAIDDLGRHLAEQVPDLPAGFPNPPIQYAAASAPSGTKETVPPKELNSPPEAGKKSAAVEVAAYNVLPLSPPVAPGEKPSALVKETSAPSGPLPTSQDSYRLQVAAFNSKSEAEQVARLLRDKGYQPEIAQATGAHQGWHRVVLGPFPSIHSAQEVGSQIKKTLPFSPIVINP